MGRDSDGRIAAVASRQYGIFNHHQTVAAEFTDDERWQRLTSGRWALVHDAVYRIAGAPTSWRGDLLAACWAGGIRAVASHRSGLALRDLPGGRRTIPEITTPRWRRARHRGVVVHESVELPDTDVTAIDGIPVTSAARTLIDAAAVLDVTVIHRAVDEALRRGDVEFGDLWQRVEELRRPGRRGIRALRSFLAQRHPDADLTESERERLLVAAIRRAGLPDPVLQYEVRDRRGRLVARPDVSYPPQRVAVEYDSYLHHGGRGKRVRDLERHNRLVAAGWQVLYVTGPQLRGGAREVCEVIRRVLARPA